MQELYPVNICIHKPKNSECDKWLYCPEEKQDTIAIVPHGSKLEVLNYEYSDKYRPGLIQEIEISDYTVSYDFHFNYGSGSKEKYYLKINLENNKEIIHFMFVNGKYSVYGIDLLMDEILEIFSLDQLSQRISRVWQATDYFNEKRSIFRFLGIGLVIFIISPFAYYEISFKSYLDIIAIFFVIGLGQIIARLYDQRLNRQIMSTYGKVI